ncbi:coiled-coil domain-containing protein 15 [Oryzias melastigma]|nr:coiled-coil domain-containing protein 15 [Oryzias melastigma]
MSAKLVRAPANRRSRAPVGQTAVNRGSTSSRVLAQRNPPVVAVGAWVEGGQDFPEHPSALALLTEELQAEKRRINEESLRRFQDEVRRRLAKRAQVCKKGQQFHPNAEVTPERSAHYHQIRAQHGSTSEEQRLSEGPNEATRKVRLRLAACRLIQEEETASKLPGGRWKISPGRHEVESPMRRTEEDVLSQHECPLVQQKISGHGRSDQAKSNPDPGFKPAVSQVLWPLTEQQELKKQQQFQFLMHRRLAMSTEREQVKENRQHRKHLQRTARIKAEKEQIRLEEERRLEEAQQLAEARHELEERELLILERLKLEEERAALLQSRKQEEKKREGGRFVEALRAQMKERLSQLKLEPPPLCCCASSFWDSHPDTCANNCVFHNNPKAYARALHSTMMSLEFR